MPLWWMVRESTVMRNVITDAIIAITLLIVCAPLFAWFSELADDPETKYGSTPLEMVFFLLMILSLVGGAILAFNTYWHWNDTRSE